MGHLRDLAGTGEDMVLILRQGGIQLRDDGGEHGWALVALREQDRSAEPAEAIQVDCGAVRIAGLSEERLSIADERCLDRVRELRPCSGPEGDLLDEQLGGAAYSPSSSNSTTEPMRA
jgi:hypothetical protein